MWLLRLLKRLVIFALFLIIVGALMFVFYQFLWFDNPQPAFNVDNLVYSTSHAAPPTGALSNIPGCADWYLGVVHRHQEGSLIFRAAAIGIPLAFSFAFGISIYTVLSIIGHAITKSMSTRRARKRYEREANRRV